MPQVSGEARLTATNCLRTAFLRIFLMISVLFAATATHAQAPVRDRIAIDGATVIDGRKLVDRARLPEHALFLRKPERREVP